MLIRAGEDEVLGGGRGQSEDNRMVEQVEGGREGEREGEAGAWVWLWRQLKWSG